MPTIAGSSPRRPVAAAIAIALATLCTAASAQQSPYYIGASQTFGHDSNIFRLPDDLAESSGTISTTSVLAGLDQPIGRQRVYASGSLGYSKYNAQPQLDGPRYDLVAGIDWETVARLSGTAELSVGRRLGSFGDRTVPAGRGENNEDYTRFRLLGRLGEWQRSRTWLEAELVRDSVENEVRLLTPTDLSGGVRPDKFEGYDREDSYTALSLGARYRWSGALVLGAGVRTEDRKIEVQNRYVEPSSRQTTDDDSKRNDFDVTASFDPGGAHKLRGRISYGKTEYENASSLDRSGFTGALQWEWRPTGKLDMTTRLNYDTEDREAGSTLASNREGNQLTTTLDWQARYAATAKIGATLSFRYSNRDFEGDGGFTDRDTTLGLGLTYTPLRSTTLGCNLSTDRRNSTAENDAFRNSYDATMASCYVQLLLQ